MEKCMVLLLWLFNCTFLELAEKPYCLTLSYCSCLFDIDICWYYFFDLICLNNFDSTTIMVVLTTKTYRTNWGYFLVYVISHMAESRDLLPEAMFVCRVALTISCLTIVTAKDDIYFDKWLDEHRISADSVDYETWKANLEYVEMHNKGGHSFTVTMNKFAHLVYSVITVIARVHNKCTHLHCFIRLVSSRWPRPHPVTFQQQV